MEKFLITLEHLQLVFKTLGQFEAAKVMQAIDILRGLEKIVDPSQPASPLPLDKSDQLDKQ